MIFNGFSRGKVRYELGRFFDELIEFYKDQEEELEDLPVRPLVKDERMILLNPGDFKFYIFNIQDKTTQEAQMAKATLFNAGYYYQEDRLIMAGGEFYERRIYTNYSDLVMVMSESG